MASIAFRTLWATLVEQLGDFVVQVWPDHGANHALIFAHPDLHGGVVVILERRIVALDGGGVECKCVIHRWRTIFGDGRGMGRCK